MTERDRELSYKSQIEDYINENKVSERAIRKDAVLCDEWIITSDKAFFEKLDQEKTRDFFETAKNYFAENYGEENIAYASVHLDESTPHMHMGVVPFENGKLSSKAMFDREELKKIQDELPKYMNEHGFDLQRGELNSEAKHKTVAEFKKDLATTEVQQELDRLNEVLKEKYEELDKIELRASESLSELDKYKNDINALEDTKRALETEIGAYKDELRDSRTLKQKDEEWRKEFTGKVKKNPITGNESVVLDKKVYDDARWSFVRQENRLLKKDEEIRQLGTQMKSLVSSNREKANRLDEIKAELKELRTENNWLRTENKGLIERLDLMTRKLNIWRKKAKEHLPTAEFKGLSKKLNEVQPLKEIIKPLKVLTKVKDVIEKSLF